MSKDRTEECLAEEVGLMVMVRGQENVKTKFNIPNQCKKGHMTLFIVPTYQYCLVMQPNIA